METCKLEKKFKGYSNKDLIKVAEQGFNKSPALVFAIDFVATIAAFVTDRIEDSLKWITQIAAVILCLSLAIRLFYILHRSVSASKLLEWRLKPWKDINP
jgi:hypothetical protein